MTKKQLEELKEKSVDLADLLRKNFDPYTVIVISDTEVKVVRTESKIRLSQI